MKKLSCLMLLSVLLFLGGCSSDPLPEVSIFSINNGEYRGIVYEGKNYWPFAVVSKNNITQTFGYVDGDRSERFGTYLDYPAEQWLVIWLEQDGGAMLLKAEDATQIPDGIKKEY